MNVRKLAVLAVGAGLALGVAACGTDAETGAAPPATTTAAAAPVATPAASASAAAEPACPVTEADLQKAVQEKTDNGVSSESKFTKIACYQGYAVATVPERSGSDEQYAVFKHDSASWSIISTGSAEICQGVPGDVVKRFREAHYGACR